MLYMEIAARCRQAAEIIGRGWCQDVLNDERGVCMMGALWNVSTVGSWPDTHLFVVNKLNCGVACWNDEPERTQAEVVAKLHAIADAAELKAIEAGEVADAPYVVIQQPVEQGELVTA